MSRSEITLPNKRLFGSIYALGIILAVIGPLLAITLFGVFVCSPLLYNGGDYVEAVPPYFLLALGLFVLGIVLVAWPGGIFRKYYRKVYSGWVVGKSTEGGGRTSLQWYVTIEGKTLGGERRTYSHEVDAGTWQGIKIGSFVNF